MSVFDVTEWDGVTVTIMAGTYVDVSKPPKPNKYGLKESDWLDSGEIAEDITFSGAKVKLTRYTQRSYMSLDIYANGVVYNLSVNKSKVRESVRLMKNNKEILIIQV